MPLRIALTGGIGSGKSTVAKLFKDLGVSIIDADEIAHHITEPNTYSFESIIEHFGKKYLKSDGTLNRKKLRDIIFKNPEEKEWLENLLHPIIREAMKERIIQAKSPYCLLVIPLLAESKKIDFIDRVCVIDTPEALQVSRVMGRDNTAASEVKAIITSQASNEKRLKIADDVIHNDGDLQKLKDQVAELNKKYLHIASRVMK